MKIILVYSLLFLSSLLAASGQILFKLGSSRGGWQILASPQTWFGLLCYGISTILWIFTLSKVELGFAYAFTAVTFFLVYVASFFIIGEAVTPAKVLGLSLVLCGFVVLCVSH